jgi:hypothetical protein
MSPNRTLVFVSFVMLLHGCGEPKHDRDAAPGRVKQDGADEARMRYRGFADARKSFRVRNGVPDAYVAGVVVEVQSNPSAYRYIPLAWTGIPDPKQAMGLDIGTATTAHDATELNPTESVVVEVGVEANNYSALFTKSNDSPNRPPSGRLFQFTANADPKVASKVAFHVDPGTGTVMLEGSCPVAETEWVAAGSDGTLFAFEVINNYRCRVYLPEQLPMPTIYFFEPSKAANSRSNERQIPGHSLTGGNVYLNISRAADGTLRFDGPYYFNGDPVNAGAPRGGSVEDWVADLLKRWKAFRP